MVLILLAIPPVCISPAIASSNALCVTLASSRSLKLLPILGVPSLPASLTNFRCLGERVDGRIGGERCCGFAWDWFDDEDEWIGCIRSPLLLLVKGDAEVFDVGLATIFVVDTDSGQAGGVVLRSAEKGKNKGASSSSSASESALRLDFTGAYRGLRAKVRLRDTDWSCSESDDELSMAEAGDIRSMAGLPSFGDVSTDLLEDS